ncbi:hypothetical protein L5B97_12075 [Avibacterium sp. 20-15]|uniref:hypothetical protein n=1 Tax=unclassified Avibacterium TaxID=2685287 RepID=UPI00202651C2|nr:MULTISPECIES: hypothetical protein [unclassified Avibacterium]MCW9734190.1 hypothetical protein [Avibacterium sp. 20-15]URL03613.1 hypothetical protein L4F93_08570 [Avibacterium sp. 20-132]URL03825.1 hypothetical protein L4F93_09725 [Avibacterium sp. 20-132]
MKWKKVRIDFTETVKCKFCNRIINSGKGILIQNEHGDFAFSGPTCAKKKSNITNYDENVIDITKGCILQDIPHSEKLIPQQKIFNENIATEYENLTPEEDTQVDNYLDENAISAYLTLRFEKLSHLKSIFTSKKLDDIYHSYITNGKISKQDENYIKQAMYGNQYPLLTYQNLQSVYAAEYWLLSFIKYNSDSDLTFINNVLGQLRKKLTLSNKQIIAINKWFIHSEGKTVKLKKNSFMNK